jgi:flagellum-specific peptidoglycan hydrolase FlgJ
MGKQPPPAIIAAAQASQAKWRIPASVILAQWALESDWGARVSGKNNFGGITAKVKDAVFPMVPGTPLEPATLCPTHEVVGGKRVSCSRWFKDFATPAAYFDRHGELLATGKPYAKARAALPDADKFADALTGVYATDPQYGASLRAIMRGSSLYKFNTGAKA